MFLTVIVYLILSPSCTVFPVNSFLSGHEIISLVFVEVISGFPASIVVSEVFSLSTFTSFVMFSVVPVKSFIVALIVSTLAFSAPGFNPFTFHVTNPSSVLLIVSSPASVSVASFNSNVLGTWSVIVASPAIVPLLIAVIV